MCCPGQGISSEGFCFLSVSWFAFVLPPESWVSPLTVPYRFSREKRIADLRMAVKQKKIQVMKIACLCCFCSRSKGPVITKLWRAVKKPLLIGTFPNKRSQLLTSYFVCEFCFWLCSNENQPSIWIRGKGFLSFLMFFEPWKSINRFSFISLQYPQ